MSKKLNDMHIKTKSSIEGKSWAIPIERKYAYLDIKKITLGEIFFATDKDKIDDDDKKQLDIIKRSITKLHNDGFKIKKLNCVGQADYRASKKYNKKLGERRVFAVKTYLSNKGIKISSKSIGERDSLQPFFEMNPSLKEIMNDRKVVISVNIKDIIAPIAIAMDYSYVSASKYLLYYFNTESEMAETNNGGHVVAYNGESVRAASKERRYLKIKDDPIKPTVLIKTKILKKKFNNKSECFLISKVIYLATGETLFWAFNDTTNIQDFNEYYCQSEKWKGRVWRQASNINRILKGSIVRMILWTDCNSKISKTFPMIYNQLKGSYDNITSRVKAILDNRNLL